MSSRPQLEPEQEELLDLLCEHWVAMPAGHREMHVFKTGRGLVFDALGWDQEINEPTLDTLRDYGLVRLVHIRNAVRCDVTNRGLDHWRSMKDRYDDPLAQVEEVVLRFLKADRFRRTCPDAYRKWTEATGLLWESNPEGVATQVGHLVREAMQSFATELGAHLRLPNVGQIDPQHTVARLQAILEAERSQSEAVQQYRQALVGCWGAIADLSQRQEHGAQKEGEDLGWEDSRRLVFNAAFIMMEIARGLTNRGT